MRISKKAEYALRALFVIARSPRGHLHQIQDLSRTENIPVKFLEQILLSLKNAAILTSRRGVGGGYMLQRDASEISLGEVIRLMDGPLAPVPCASPRPLESCTCPDPAICPLRNVMSNVRNQLSDLLDHLSLEAALRQAGGHDVLAFDI